MKTYKLQGKVTISVFTEIEASTLKEAEEIAEDFDVVKNEWGQESLKKEHWVSDEYDGEVYDVEEVQ